MNRGGSLGETEGRGRKRETEGRPCPTCPFASGSFAHSSSLMGGPWHGLTHQNPLDFQSDPCKAKAVQARINMLNIVEYVVVVSMPGFRQQFPLYRTARKSVSARCWRLSGFSPLPWSLIHFAMCKTCKIWWSRSCSWGKSAWPKWQRSMRYVRKCQKASLLHELRTGHTHECYSAFAGRLSHQPACKRSWWGGFPCVVRESPALVILCSLFVSWFSGSAFQLQKTFEEEGFWSKLEGATRWFSSTGIINLGFLTHIDSTYALCQRPFPKYIVMGGVMMTFIGGAHRS